MKNKQCPCCGRGFRQPAPPAPRGSAGPPFRLLLQDAAERAGVTNSELAGRLGVVQHRVPAIFRTANLTERLFKEVARALGMRVEVRLIKEKKT